VPSADPATSQIEIQPYVYRTLQYSDTDSVNSPTRYTYSTVHVQLHRRNLASGYRTVVSTIRTHFQPVFDVWISCMPCWPASSTSNAPRARPLAEVLAASAVVLVRA
jgi:hypothetical protein